MSIDNLHISNHSTSVLRSEIRLRFSFVTGLISDIRLCIERGKFSKRISQPMKTYVDRRAMPLVGGVLRVASGSQSDSGVGSIVDGVETLTIQTDQQVKGAGWDDAQECKSVDKV